MALHRFDRARLAATPWKNGGGVTREIVCRPERAGMNGFDWRASIATIASDGPFSTFSGVDRVIVLLDGSGVRLQSDDGRIDHGLDAPLQPFAFDGGADIACTRLGGESTDFNVMTRRAICHADVRVARHVQRLSACARGLLFAARGAWHVGEVDDAVDDPVLLSAESGLWWDEEPHAWQLTPADADAALLTVQVWPRTDWSNA